MVAGMRGIRAKIVGFLGPVLLVLLVVGCGDDGPARPEGVATGEPVSAHTSEVIGTSRDDALPEGCSPRRVAGLLIRFLDAFNQGRQEELSSAFFVSEGPSPPDFSAADYHSWSWYSSRQLGGGGTALRPS